MERAKEQTSLNKYEIQTSPYRGKRKYIPFVLQDCNGTFIRNDVFGLTIAQFEREFKKLLERRKENEEHIQNIRFPVKSTNEYIEYIKYGDDTIEGFRRIEESVKEDHQFFKLLQVAGTEYDIRTRQRMFILIDNVQNKLSDTHFKQISSGSLAEGIDLAGSDIDIMIELVCTDVVDDLKHLHISTRSNTLLMENDIRHPGFCKLKVVMDSSFSHDYLKCSLKETTDGLYLSINKFIHYFRNTIFRYARSCVHGPCISDAALYFDLACCLRSIFWPTIADNWCNRHRNGQWPSDAVINEIRKDGCLLVPIGPKTSDCDLLWRISFSLAEKRLTHSMNYTQLLCYVLLKLILKHMINRNEQDLLCSYFLKTTVFWLSEEISINYFKISNLSQCFSLCIEKLSSFVRNVYCPNYFIPCQNMFIGKINECNKEPLLKILEELQTTDLPVIMFSIPCMDGINISSSNLIGRKELSAEVELLFYRVLNKIDLKDTSAKKIFTALKYINLSLKLESSDFLIDILRFYYAKIKREISQNFILPYRNRLRYLTIRYIKHYLTDGPKTDDLSGMLLHASFYYVIADYKKTLRIVDKVLSSCSPEMLIIGSVDYSVEEKEIYKHKTKRITTLDHKMRQSTLHFIRYTKRSTLIPQELHLEVQTDVIDIHPIIMSQCLQFLCFHHLGFVKEKQLFLRVLHRSVEIVAPSQASWLSVSFVILGVCHEISGDKAKAYQCYNKALHCMEEVCPSAEQRLTNVFRT